MTGVEAMARVGFGATTVLVVDTGLVTGRASWTEAGPVSVPGKTGAGLGTAFPPPPEAQAAWMEDSLCGLTRLPEKAYGRLHSGVGTEGGQVLLC